MLSRREKFISQFHPQVNQETCLSRSQGKLKCESRFRIILETGFFLDNSCCGLRSRFLVSVPYKSSATVGKCLASLLAWLGFYCYCFYCLGAPAHFCSVSGFDSLMTSPSHTFSYGSIDFWGRIILCCQKEADLMLCRMFSSIPASAHQMPEILKL